jgi:hypothetical protein
VRLLPAEPADPPGTTRLDVTVHPPKQGGDVSSYVMLETSHAKVTTVPLMINLLSLDAITVRPPSIYWTAVAAQPLSLTPRLITLTKRSGPFRILEANADHPQMKLEVRHPKTRATTNAAASSGGGADTYHEISLSYAGGLPKGTYAGKLVITTDDTDSPRVEIPYRVGVE